MLKVRTYKKEDYLTLKKWWDTYKDWTAVPEDFLPELGLVVEYDNIPISAGFIYTTNSKVAWFEWTIADPEASKDQRSDAVDELIKNVLTISRLKGIKYIMTSISHPSLIKRLESNGFAVTDTNMQNMVKIL